MTIYSILATTAIQQACDLFRDKSNKKDQHGCRKQQAAHVRKPVLGEVGVDVIAKACRKKSQADGQKNLKRGIKCSNLKND